MSEKSDFGAIWSAANSIAKAIEALRPVSPQGSENEPLLEKAYQSFNATTTQLLRLHLNKVQIELDADETRFEDAHAVIIIRPHLGSKNKIRIKFSKIEELDLETSKKVRERLMNIQELSQAGLFDRNKRYFVEIKGTLFEIKSCAVKLPPSKRAWVYDLHGKLHRCSPETLVTVTGIDDMPKVKLIIHADMTTFQLHDETHSMVKHCRFPYPKSITTKDQLSKWKWAEYILEEKGYPLDHPLYQRNNLRFHQVCDDELPKLPADLNWQKAILGTIRNWYGYGHLKSYEVDVTKGTYLSEDGQVEFQFAPELIQEYFPAMTS